MIPDYYNYCYQKHSGERAFVVGAGTSLYDLDLSKIHNHVVISINSSILLMPWDDGDFSHRYWISNDSLCMKWSWWNKVLRSKCCKIVRNSWSKYFEELSKYNFLQFTPRSTPENIVEKDDKGLCYCSSVPSGIDLAIKMGCKEIFLLGVDQYMIGNKSHFWQYYPYNKQPRKKDGILASFSQQKWTFSYNDKAYSGLKLLCDEMNIKIVNCNLKSRVNIFDKIDFKDI